MGNGMGGSRWGDGRGQGSRRLPRAFLLFLSGHTVVYFYRELGHQRRPFPQVKKTAANLASACLHDLTF